MTNVQGPFGPQGPQMRANAMMGGIPDLGAMAAARAMQDEQEAMAAEGKFPLPVVAIQMGTQLVNDVHQIAQLLSLQVAGHIPTIAQLTNEDGQPAGFGCFCYGCSNPEVGQFIFPCRVLPPEILATWPHGQVLAVIDHGESPVSATNPDIPDTPEGAENGHEPRHGQGLDPEGR